VYEFARQPKWIAGHVLTLVLLVAFLAAGSWQYSRHNERREANARIEARSALEDLHEQDMMSLVVDEAEFRTATLAGTWVGHEAVLIRNRSFNGAAGCHVVAPLAIDETTAVAINLGWVEEVRCSLTAADLVGLDGDAIVQGRLRASQHRGRLGPKDRSTGHLETMARIDLDRLDQQVSLQLAPLYVEALEPHIDILPVSAPTLDAGPHLGYAVQWLLFFGVGAVGYPIVLRHHAHKGQNDLLAD
jgi:surfeit locus 1 family protein